MSRKQLMDVGFKNNTVLSVLPFAAFPGMQPFFDEAQDILKEYPVDTYDVTKSDQIMQKKGYSKDAGGFWAKDGKRLSFIVMTFPGFFENFARALGAWGGRGASMAWTRARPTAGIPGATATRTSGSTGTREATRTRTTASRRSTAATVPRWVSPRTSAIAGTTRTST